LGKRWPRFFGGRQWLDPANLVGRHLVALPWRVAFLTHFTGTFYNASQVSI
jgi:hypothetical protein